MSRVGHHDTWDTKETAMRASRAAHDSESVSHVCARIEPRLEAYHDDALSERDTAAVREHLLDCERCSECLRALEQVDRLLRQAPAPMPGPDLRQQLYARIAQTQQPARRRIGVAGGATSAPRPRVAAAISSASQPPRLSSVFAGAVAALTVTALVLLALTRLPAAKLGMGHTSTNSSASASVSAVVKSFAGLPKFADWRAAYLGADHQVHLVSMDGRQAITAPSLPQAALLTATPLPPYQNVAASPDGHALAYISGGGATLPGIGVVSAGPITVLDLPTGALSTFDVLATACYWAPTQHVLAALGADPSTPALYRLQSGSAVATLIPRYAGQVAFLRRIVGWTDDRHVLAIFNPSPAPLVRATTSATPAAAPLAQPLAQSLSGGLSRIGLGIVDMSTGDVRLLGNLPLEPETFLSPDGKALFIPTSWWNDTAMLVDTSTGHIRLLPAIGRTFTGKLQRVRTSLDAPNANWAMHAAWRPGDTQVALSLASGGPTPTGGAVTQPSGTWLLDLAADSATQVTFRTYPLAWVPQTKALVTADPPDQQADGSYPANGVGVGPTLYLLPPTSGAQETPIAHAMAAYLGLVRTA
jgi:anti-sigma factor RsiW